MNLTHFFNEKNSIRVKHNKEKNSASYVSITVPLQNLALSSSPFRSFSFPTVHDRFNPSLDTVMDVGTLGTVMGLKSTDPSD